MTVSSWIDAIYLSKRFPSVPMVIYFGPPVMLQVGEDVVQGNTAVVEYFWKHIRDLTRKAVVGEVLIAGESLFRPVGCMDD